MKVVYSLDQKREALAYARREGVSAASKQYGVAKNTIYRWKAAMELNGLLEGEANQPNETDGMDLSMEATVPVTPAILLGKLISADPTNTLCPDSDSAKAPGEQPAGQQDMNANVEDHRSLVLESMPSITENSQPEDYQKRNKRLCTIVTANNPEILAMILDENERLHRENQQLRRAMQVLLES